MQENPTSKMTPIHQLQLSEKYKYLYHAGFHVPYFLLELNSSHTAECRGGRRTQQHVQTQKACFSQLARKWYSGENEETCFLLIFIILVVRGGVETNLVTTGETLRKSK